MRIFSKALAICAAVSVLAISGVANATFMVDQNPSGTKLFLTSAKDAAMSTGTVITPDDVAISVMGNADFASGFSTIKPVKGGSLTDLIFTPNNPNEFNSFSFRGQNLVANQTIDVIVTDNQGDAPQTIPFTFGNANQDFARSGIVSRDGETIKSVELVNDGGFKEAKQFEFDIAGSVPEPTTWALMIVGVGMVGFAARRRRGLALAA